MLSKKRKKNSPKYSPKKSKKEYSRKDNCKKGDDSVNYLIALILATGEWEVKKMGEGTAADFAVRRRGTDDAWMPFQAKSCSTGNGRFQNLHGYANMIMCLVELTDGVGGNVWIGRRDDFPPIKVENIYGKKGGRWSTETYDPFRVLNPANLNARLHSFDSDSYVVKRSLNYWNVPSTGKTRKERLSVILFERIAASFGHTIVAPKYENTATDWYLNRIISGQDKTAGAMIAKQYYVNLHKCAGFKNGKRQTQPYAVCDNQFYLVFVGDKPYTDKFMKDLSIEEFLDLSNTASLRGCYLFSEAELVATGHIATATQKGLKAIYLPVPNADGSFEPESKHSPGRKHNFQQNYFHKTMFEELFQKMIL